MAADIDRRGHVEKMYSGPSWKRKVANMSDGQIFAIYTRDMRKKEAELAAKKAAKKATNNDDIPF